MPAPITPHRSPVACPRPVAPGAHPPGPDGRAGRRPRAATRWRVPVAALLLAIATGAGARAQTPGAPAAPPPAGPRATDGAGGPTVRPSRVRLDSVALAADLALLRRALTTLHPGLLRYKSPAGLDSAFAALARDWGREQTVAEAFVALSRFTAALRCGHTYPNYWNQRRPLRADLLEGPDKLPFTYRLVGGRMLVERSAMAAGAAAGGERPALGRGDEVVAINGVPATALIDTLVALVRGDGDNDGKRRSLAELRGLKRFEAADAFIPLLAAPRPAADGALRYQVEVRRGGRTVTLALPAMHAAERNANALPAADPPLAAAAPWSWRVQGAVGVLRSDGFAGEEARGAWRTFLRRSFGEARARGLTAVVVDLRGNEGGADDDALLLLSHLARRAIPLPAVRQVVAYDRVPDAVRPHVDSWDPSFYDRRGRVTPLGDGTFAIAGGAVPRSVSPAREAFGGRVMLLVGPVASSASHWLTQAAQAAGVATVVGEPTGGSLRGSTAAQLFFLRLPNSGLEVDVPLVATHVAGVWPATGVIPQVPIAPSPADFVAGRDVALARALAEAAGGGTPGAGTERR